MVSTEMRSQPHVPFSQLDQYLRCPLKSVLLCGASVSAWNGEGAVVVGISARAPAAGSAAERLLDGGPFEIGGQDLPRCGGHDLVCRQDAVMNERVDHVPRRAELARGVDHGEIAAVSDG